MLCLLPQAGHSWGFWAHQRINRLAVFTLPPEMLFFYKHYIEYLTEHAVDPDKRRYAVDGEAARHYLDADHYGELPFPELPRRWDEAVAKYSEDSLMAYGIVPWYLPLGVYKLQKAFEEGDLAAILR
ncbi:MAG: S1/P1 Nuclease, partial [Bacteroidetes bacterium]